MRQRGSLMSLVWKKSLILRGVESHWRVAVKMMATPLVNVFYRPVLFFCTKGPHSAPGLHMRERRWLSKYHFSEVPSLDESSGAPGGLGCYVYAADVESEVDWGFRT